MAELAIPAYGERSLADVGPSLPADVVIETGLYELEGDLAAIRGTIPVRTSMSDVTDLVARIYKAIREPFECLGHRLLTNASIGIALARRPVTLGSVS